jgi:PHD/YefM family antitoxin component YafN of YafNO toxin-antitoxin module
MKELKAIKEIAAQYDAHPQVHQPIVIDREGDTVSVAMKEADFRALEEWLARQPLRDDEHVADAEARLAEGYERGQRTMLAPEIEAYKKMLPELLKTHKGKWVAIHQGRLVSAADDRVALLKHVRRAYPHQATYCVLVEERHPPIFDMDTPEEESDVALISLQHQ